MRRPAKRLGIAERIARLGAMLAILLAVRTSAIAEPSIFNAVSKGNDELVAAMLKKSPGLVASVNKEGDTPLHIAALHDRLAIAALLLANGANVNALTSPAPYPDQTAGATPLAFAMLSYHHKRMMELLLVRGADPNIVLGDGQTALMRAVGLRSADDVKLLLANNANPNAQAREGGSTPLLMAVYADERKIVEILLANGADPNLKDDAGLSPLHAAINPPPTSFSQGEAPTSDAEIVAILRAHGAHM